MCRVVVRIELDKIKSNVISLDVRVLSRKIMSLRFLEAVLCCVHPLVPGTLRSHVLP